MNKYLLLGLIGFFLIGFVSSYICVNPQEDNEAVQEFKMDINKLAIQEDIKSGLTPEGLRIKLKYFGPCDK